VPLLSTMYNMLMRRRTMCANWPRPIDALSPSPETPMQYSSEFAMLAPVATEGMRPCTELKPCDRFRK